MGWDRLLTKKLKKTFVKQGSLREIFFRALDAIFVSRPVRLRCIVWRGPSERCRKGSNRCKASYWICVAEMMLLTGRPAANWKGRYPGDISRCWSWGRNLLFQASGWGSSIRSVAMIRCCNRCISKCCENGSDIESFSFVSPIV